MEKTNLLITVSDTLIWLVWFCVPAQTTETFAKGEYEMKNKIKTIEAFGNDQGDGHQKATEREREREIRRQIHVSCSKSYNQGQQHTPFFSSVWFTGFWTRTQSLHSAQVRTLQLKSSKSTHGCWSSLCLLECGDLGMPASGIKWRWAV